MGSRGCDTLDLGLKEPRFLELLNRRGLKRRQRGHLPAENPFDVFFPRGEVLQEKASELGLKALAAKVLHNLVVDAGWGRRPRDLRDDLP